MIQMLAAFILYAIFSVPMMYGLFVAAGLFRPPLKVLKAYLDKRKSRVADVRSGK
jgi:hypothetical protein